MMRLTKKRDLSAYVIAAENLCNSDPFEGPIIFFILFFFFFFHNLSYPQLIVCFSIRN